MAKFGRLCGAKYLQRHDDLQRFSAEVLAAARADLALCSEHISAGSSSLKEGFMSDAAKRRGAEHGSWRQGLLAFISRKGSTLLLGGFFVLKAKDTPPPIGQRDLNAETASSRQTSS